LPPSKTKKTEKMVTYVFIITTLLAVLISSVSISLYFDMKLSDQTYREQAVSLETAQNTFSQLNDRAKNLIMLFKNSTKVNDLLENGVSDINNLKSQIINLSEYNIELKSSPKVTLYLVDFKRECVYTAYLNGSYYFTFDTFFDKKAIDNLKNAGIDDKYKPEFKTVLHPNGEEFDCITYYSFEGNSVSYDNKAIILNIDANWLKEQMAVLCDNGDSILMSDLSLDNFYLHSKGKNHIDLIRSNIKSNEKDSGRFVLKTTGQKDMLSYVKSQTLGFAFYKTSDYSAITKALLQLRLTLIFIVFVLFAVSVVITKIISHRLYIKVDSDLKTIYSPLKDDMRELSDLFDYFSLNTTEAAASSSESITKMLTGYDMDPNKKIMLSLCKTDDVEAFYSEHSLTYADAIRYAVINVSCEIFGTYVTVKGTVIDRQSCLFLIGNIDDNIPNSRLLLLSYQIQAHLKKIFGLSVSFFFSKASVPQNFRNLVFDVKATSKLSLISGYSCVLTASDVDKHEESEFPVPAEICQQAAKLISLNKFGDLKQLLSDSFFTEYENFSIDSITETILFVVSTLKSAIYMSEKNSMIDLSSISEHVHNILSLDNMESIKERFILVLDKLNQTVSGQAETNIANQQKRYLNEICSYVLENYQDIDLNVESIADKLNLSTIYACRVFKKDKGITLGNYINEVRIEKACELLRTTSLSAQEISRKCGIQNTNYFYTMFKKHKNMTANRYKSLYGQGVDDVSPNGET